MASSTYIKVVFQPEQTPATPFNVRVISNGVCTSGRNFCRNYDEIERFIAKNNLDHLPVR